MARAIAEVPTTNGSKYLQQLCKHWSHKLEVAFDAAQGTVRFPEAVATMTAGPQSLLVAIEAEDPAVVERMKGVVSSHLDRFAFREAPLMFDWR
jgi:hypothetical protein